MKEKQNIEYKSIWKEKYLQWICGFANAQGGTLHIGKDDNGHVIGVRDAKQLLEELPNKITTILGIVADVNLHETDQGDYIEIVVEPHPNPVNYKGEYHYRSGSTKQELKGAALDKFLLQKYGKKWDGVIVPNVTIEDLSLVALQRFRNEAAKSGRVDEGVLRDNTKHLLQDLQLMDENSDSLKRAAVLLFHPKPEKFVTGAYVKIGFFQGDDDDLAFQDEVRGSLMEQIDKAFDLLKSKYLYYAISYEGVSRREKAIFPLAALRESLLNALVHKDYASGVPIQISVYPNRIVFWNPGYLPYSIPIEELLQKHPSIPYNPDIANTLFRSGDIEIWGRGYRKIIKSALEHKLLPPVIKDLGGLMLTYYTDAFSQLIAERVEEKVIQIVEYVIVNGSISNSETQKLLNTSKPTATRLLKQANNWLRKQGERGQGTIYVLKWNELVGS
jgi:ATP-dependent DNA helicase RecG